MVRGDAADERQRHVALADFHLLQNPGLESQQVRLGGETALAIIGHEIRQRRNHQIVGRIGLVLRIWRGDLADDQFAVRLQPLQHTALDLADGLVEDDVGSHLARLADDDLLEIDITRLDRRAQRTGDRETRADLLASLPQPGRLQGAVVDVKLRRFMALRLEISGVEIRSGKQRRGARIHLRRVGRILQRRFAAEQPIPKRPAWIVQHPQERTVIGADDHDAHGGWLT